MNAQTGPRALLEAARDSAAGGRPLPPAGVIDAPELGPGAKLPLKRLSIGDRLRLVEIKDAAASPVALLLAGLPLCVCEPDGSPTFADPPAAADAELIRLFPAKLAERAMAECVRLAREDGDPKASGVGSTPTPG